MLIYLRVIFSPQNIGIGKFLFKYRVHIIAIGIIVFRELWTVKIYWSWWLLFSTKVGKIFQNEVKTSRAYLQLLIIISLEIC